MIELFVPLENAIKDDWEGAYSIKNTSSAPLGAWAMFELIVSRELRYIVVGVKYPGNEFVIHCKKVASDQELDRYLSELVNGFPAEKLPESTYPPITFNIQTRPGGGYGFYKIDGTEYIANNTEQVVKASLSEIRKAFEALESGIDFS